MLCQFLIFYHNCDILVSLIRRRIALSRDLTEYKLSSNMYFNLVTLDWSIYFELAGQMNQIKYLCEI